MKCLLLSVFFASAAISAAAADSPSMNGNWKVHIDISGNEADVTCSFTQKDADLSGTCTGEHGTSNVTGTVTDKKVKWTYKSQYNDSPITLTYTGTLTAADKASGTVDVQEYGAEGDFTATATK